MERSNKGYKNFLGWLGVVVLVVGLLVVGTAQSQIISGDIVGTVYDKTGAVVPNAKISLTNVATGVTHETTASSNGEYRFSNLPVGTYDVQVSAANFATTKIPGFKVELNKASTLPVTLELSTATTSIEVV